MSIQGVQPKLSAKLSIKDQRFEVVDQKGTYILKPQSGIYDEVPENEDVTMKMARQFGIDVPDTGMLFSKDGSLTYFIKRFDRYGRNKKYHTEDFAQLTHNTRDTKYKWSMEKLIPVLDEYCTFPVIEKRKLFKRFIFCFVTGNEDMHLKNFSLIRKKSRVELSPAYDLLNSTLAIRNAVEEIALALSGKKSRLKKKQIVDYYGKERLGLSSKIVESEIDKLHQYRSEMEQLILNSFLSEEKMNDYLEIMNERYMRLM